MLKKITVLELRYSISCFIIFVSLLTCSFSTRQINSRVEINKKLILGRWNYTNALAGNILMVFKEDGSGYRSIDSMKIIQKFKYKVSNTMVKFYMGRNKPEIYYIDILTTKTLALKEYPFIRNRENIGLFQAQFERGSPAPGEKPKNEAVIK